VTAARNKLDRLKQIADEMGRENPDVPVAELLDLQRVLKRALPKMRALKAAGYAAEAGALAVRVRGMCREMEELLTTTHPEGTS
jgi:hypothetical protein